MAMWKRTMPEPERNPLVGVVQPIPAKGRRALYAAANAGLLRRGTWDGCAFNRAGLEIGIPIRSRGEAAHAFGTTPEAVRDFIEVWDRLWGSNRHCTQLLRDALEHVGLFDDADEGATVPGDALAEAPAP